VVLALLLLALLAAVGCVGWLAWTGLQARGALLAAQPVVSRVQQQVLDGDADGARASLADLQVSTADARASTHDPVWAAAEQLPAVGDDVRVVRQLTTLVDDVAQQALPPLVAAAGSLDPAALQPVDGAIDLAPLQAAAPLLREADEAMQAAVTAGAGINTTGVDERIAEPAGELLSQLDAAAGTTATGARAAALLPGMLGADRPRTYLVLFQNNAEVRATGGIPGSTAVIRADGGRVTIESQSATGDIPQFAESVLPLSDEFVAMHTTKPGRFIQDVNFTPHFPTSAQLAREMWRRVSQQEVDGVLSVDPVALSYLLNATGPLPLAGDVQISADNAVDLLLSRVYAEIDSPALQDAFFAAAATSIFTGLTSGAAEPTVLLEQLARAAGERRLLVWSSDPAEQGLLAGTVLEGALPTGPDGGPAVGVYLNDGTAAKMSFYLRHEVTVREVCDAELPTYTVQTRLWSVAPADAATSTSPARQAPTAQRSTRRSTVPNKRVPASAVSAIVPPSTACTANTGRKRSANALQSQASPSAPRPAR